MQYNMYLFISSPSSKKCHPVRLSSRDINAGTQMKCHVTFNHKTLSHTWAMIVVDLIYIMGTKPRYLFLRFLPQLGRRSSITSNTRFFFYYACLCNVKLVTSDLCCRKNFHIYVVVDMAPSQMWNSFLYKDFRSWRWASWHTAVVYVTSPHWRQRHRYLVNVSRTDLMHLRFDFSEIFISCLSSGCRDCTSWRGAESSKNINCETI